MKKRDYEKQKAEIEMDLDMVEHHISEAILLGDPLNMAKSEAYLKDLGLSGIDEWNLLYDAKHDLEDRLESLERQWDTRNWTGSDWNTWELVAQNID